MRATTWVSVIEEIVCSTLTLTAQMDEKVEAVSASNALEVDAEKHVDNTISVEKYPPPTDQELGTLRKVAETLPLVSFSLCLVEFAERASYYGAKTVFSNFIQFPLPKGMTTTACSSVRN